MLNVSDVNTETPDHLGGEGFILDDLFQGYLEKLTALIGHIDTDAVKDLALALRSAWQEDRQVFLCGNGGSAANAMHIANDFLYGISQDAKGIRAHALPASQPIVTCLANDISYEEIFSKQLEIYGQPGDILIVLSGSGNSMNVVRAIEKAKEIGIKTYALLGYSGGKCLEMADSCCHFKVDDMQISEDLQLVVGHMLMRWLRSNSINNAGLRL